MYITITTDLLKDKKRRGDMVRLLQELIQLESGHGVARAGPSDDPGHKLLRREQVTELVPVSRATLHRMVVDGKFPAPKRIGGQLAWRASDVFRWIESEDTDGDRKRSADRRTKNFKRAAQQGLKKKSAARTRAKK
jgi:prophage regulatory protein